MDQQPNAPQDSSHATPVQPVRVPSSLNLLPNIPDQWPGAWGLYKYSKQAVMQNWGVLLGLLVLYSIIDGIPRGLIGNAGSGLGFLISMPFAIALIVAYLASVRGQKISFGSAMSAGLNPTTFVSYFINILVVALLLSISFILLIVPFFFVFPRVILAPYFLIDKDMGPIEAIRASYEVTKDNKGKVWGVMGATIAMCLLMLTIIGIPFSLYFLFMYGAAFVLLYAFLTRSQHTVASAETTPASQPPAHRL
jgi:hypothetical protein